MFSRWFTFSHLIKPQIPQRKLCKALNTSQLNLNPYYEKYAEKISQLKKTSPENLKQSVIQDKKAPHEEGCSSSLSQAQTSSVIGPKPKTLNEIMKLQLLQDKSSEDIESIWKNYHMEKTGLYSVLSTDAYEKMYSMFMEYPTFLFPLPRGQGFEFIMCQFESNSCHFTSLINYQAFKENAPVCLTLTYFTELSKSKGLVLMRGEFNEDELKIPEAQCLANQLQLYYSGKDNKKQKLLWHFNKQPETFKYVDLISELDYV